MAFTDLPIDLQNIYITNIELGIKVILFIFVIYCCIKQIQKIKEKKKTPYFLVGLIRGVTGMLSYTTLALMPLVGAFFFYPGFKMDTVQIMLLTVYLIAGIVTAIIFFVNVMFFSGSYVLKLAGYDPLEGRTNKVLNDLERFTGDLKIERNKIINNFKGFK